MFNHLAILGVEFLHLHKFAMVTAIIRDELCCDLDWLGAVDLEVANACNVRRSPALSISTAGLNLFLGHAACFTSKDLKEDEAPTSRAHGEASPGVDDHGLTHVSKEEHQHGRCQSKGGRTYQSRGRAWRPTRSRRTRSSAEGPSNLSRCIGTRLGWPATAPSTRTCRNREQLQSG